MKNNTTTILDFAKLSGFPIMVISEGRNMNGKKIITKSLLSYEDGEFYLWNGGFRFKVDNETAQDLYLDSKKNRETLRKSFAKI